jgi:hypothetical protein
LFLAYGSGDEEAERPTFKRSSGLSSQRAAPQFPVQPMTTAALPR